MLQHYQVRQILLQSQSVDLPKDENEKELLKNILLEIQSELTKDGAYDELKNHPLPLWLQRPDIEYGSIGWRMGAGVV